MPKFYKKIRGIGIAPGSLETVPDEQKTTIRLFDYSPNALQEKTLITVEESFSLKDTPTISWIDIDGRDVNIIQEINTHFGVHPLVLEDIVNRGQRPKIEDYDTYLFFVLKMIHFDAKNNDIDSEQIGLVLGENFVISFQEREGDIFEPIRVRIREGKGRIRKMGADYLAYALFDAIVDHYFLVLEQLGGEIDQLEEELLEKLEQDMPLRIHKLKSQMIYLRKHIWPLREVLSHFERGDSQLVKKETRIFLRDVYDHTIQINETIEALRETLSGLHDIYLSSISNRMNEIMKILTLFAAIFIPLTFIVGIYGMNFENMPELKMKYGYFTLLTIMALLGLGMFFFFKKRKWL